MTTLRIGNTTNTVLGQRCFRSITIVRAIIWSLLWSPVTRQANFLTGIERQIYTPAAFPLKSPWSLPTLDRTWLCSSPAF